MRGYVANTDFDWYVFLRSQPELDEVNFWLPSDTRAFRSIPVGAPFFFKLKRPHYAIGGFGFYAGHSVLPAWLAWDTYGIGNGAPDFEEMRRRIEKYRRPRTISPQGNYYIGCLMIYQPVFFSPDDWIPQPADWKKNVVQGATYDLTEGEGRRVWEACLGRIENSQLEEKPLVALEVERYGSEQVIRPRLGQCAFRVTVLDAYGRSCAISDEHSLPVLDSAHIKPYARSGSHDPSNGLLLRSDIHRLFDHGYVTVTPEYRFEVSRRLKDDFENGRSYYPYHGKQVRLPGLDRMKPSPELLAWHNEEVFQ